jgi:hypothetical protein
MRVDFLDSGKRSSLPSITTHMQSTSTVSPPSTGGYGMKRFFTKSIRRQSRGLSFLAPRLVVRPKAAATREGTL